MRKYELSISADYVPGWGITEAVREFFQNSIDEETRDSSNKMLFEYDEAEEKLIIGNKHSELDIKTLLFGTTTKNDDDKMIGNHGEGYKIATVVLLRLGKTVVFTPETVLAPACSPVISVMRMPSPISASSSA